MDNYLYTTRIKDRYLETIIQITGWFLRLNGGRMAATHLKSLIYISEMKSIKEYNSSITLYENLFINEKKMFLLNYIDDFISYNNKQRKSFFQGLCYWNKYFTKKDDEIIIKDYMIDNLNLLLNDKALWLCDADIEIMEKVYLNRNLYIDNNSFDKIEKDCKNMFAKLIIKQKSSNIYNI